MSEDRRGFLAGLALALFGIPGVAALLGSRRTRGRWIDAGPLDALPDGEPKRFAYEVAAGWEKGRKTCFLVRKGDAVIALDATCTHAGCTVHAASGASAGELGGAPAFAQGASAGKPGAFVCPCHGGAFSIDGEPAKRPVTRPLARLETRVEDGHVKVRT